MNKFFIFLFSVAFIALHNPSFGQDAASVAKYKTSAAKLGISGTSTMHDWTMTSKNGTCSAQIEVNGTSVKSIKSMQFNVNVSDLKSGKGGMDNNAYKALKSDKNPNISAEWISGTVTGNSFNGKIKLTIAGTTKETNLEGTVTANSNGNITVNGTKSFNMEDYGVKPPSFAFGAMKTGKDIVLKFDLVLTK
ncbi:MAG: YceI family protein [Saprospiraceae bacterium]